MPSAAERANPIMVSYTVTQRSVRMAPSARLRTRLDAIAVGLETKISRIQPSSTAACQTASRRARSRIWPARTLSTSDRLGMLDRRVVDDLVAQIRPHPLIDLMKAAVALQVDRRARPCELDRVHRL